MVDSGSGRTDLAEAGQRRPQPRGTPETEHRDMREPRSLLALVHAEPLQAFEDVQSEALRVPADVVEHEHADAPGLAVAVLAEPDRAGCGSGLSQLGRDRPGLGGGTAAEERDRGVEVLPRHGTPVSELATLPVNKRVEHRIGQRESAEEP